MNSKWMNKTLLAVSVQMLMGVAYANEPALGGYDAVEEQAVAEDTTLGGYDSVDETATTPADSATQAEAPVAQESAPAQTSDASAALQKQEGDATQEANLQEVFTSNERQYSLIKKGEISSYYDIDYTYYRDTQLDMEMAEGQ